MKRAIGRIKPERDWEGDGGIAVSRPRAERE
jgi:hypothetical protein